MSSREFGGFGGEGYEFENRPEVDAWLRDRATDPPGPSAAARFEILDGEQVALAPITEAHAACVTRLTRLLVDALGDQAVVSVGNPVRLDEDSQPCPDVAVLTPRPDGYYEGRFATVEDILLLVEVSDSTFSLTHDRGRKSSYYARCGIVECWIVDLMSGQILVHRSPASGGYRDIRNMRADSTLTVESLPGLTLTASAILGG